jgi:hypothetical protein
VPVADRYFLLARYAVPTASARMLIVDGQPVGEFAFPATGGYGSNLADNWGTAALMAQGKPVALSLTAGKHTFRLENANGIGLNLDALDLVAAQAPAPAADLPGWRRVEAEGSVHLRALAGTICPSQIRHEIGHLYQYDLGPYYPGDGVKDAPPSTLMMFEDGKPLGPAHTAHVRIREEGKGLFAHWGTTLWFAASDGSDPSANGRTYTWEIP